MLEAIFLLIIAACNVEGVTLPLKSQNALEAKLENLVLTGPENTVTDPENTVTDPDGHAVGYALTMEDCDAIKTPKFCQFHKNKTQQVRELFIEDEVLRAQISTLNSMSKTGGKSNAAFMISKDKNLILKRCLPKAEKDVIEKMFTSKTSNFQNHYAKDNPLSRINPIYMFGRDEGENCKSNAWFPGLFGTETFFWILIPSSTRVFGEEVVPTTQAEAVPELQDSNENKNDLTAENEDVPTTQAETVPELQANNKNKNCTTGDYDLKGSSRAKIEVRKAKCNDCDFQADVRSLHLTTTGKEELKAVIKKDIEFLKAFNVIDYSFMVSRRDVEEGSASKAAPDCNFTQAELVRTGELSTRPNQSNSNSSKLERKCKLSSEDKSSMYSFEIIDYAVDFGFGKQLESAFKQKKFQDYDVKMKKRLDQILTKDGDPSCMVDQKLSTPTSP